MVFVVESGRAKVNKHNVRVPDHIVFASLLRVVVDVVLMVHKEDILWFEVRVCESR